MRVGFVGLGKMGMPMLERLCASGFEVLFYARNPQSVAAATTLGGLAAESVNEVARRVDVMIVCTFSDEQVRELALGEDGFATEMQPGSTLIIHTTGSPETARAIAGKIAASGARVLDAPLSGGPHDIGAGAITLLVGGDAATLKQCEPVLSSYGRPILHTGPLGSGQAVKLVNNLLFSAHIELVAEAARILDELGVDRGSALEAISHCSGDSKVLRLAQKSGSIERLIASAGTFIAKDRATAEAVAKSLDVDTGLLGKGEKTTRF